MTHFDGKFKLLTENSLGEALTLERAELLDPDVGALILFLILLSILLVPLLVVLSSLVWSLHRMVRLGWSLPEVWTERRAEFFKGLIPPLLFSFVVALIASAVIGLIWYMGPGVFGSPTAIPGLIAITLTLFVAFGLSWLLPVAWYGTEWLSWRFSLGGSTTAKMLRNQALRDFRLSIRQRETDQGFQAPIAFLFALGARIFEFPYLHCSFKRMKDEKERLTSNNRLLAE